MSDECRAGTYEFFEHTADVGIRATGATLEELLVRMAQGLVELIAEDSRLEPAASRPIRLAADGASALLLKWLQELLFWFSAERFLPVAYELEEVTPTSLRGRVRGDTFDPTRHVQGREVKAITRHLLEVAQRNGCWHGQVIVDI
jgi:SHS2 domain-containing protein